MEARIAKLNQTIQGWVNYYKLADMGKYCQKTDEWLRRRLRMCFWKQWKKIGTRQDNLVRLGTSCSKLGNLLTPEKATGILPIAISWLGSLTNDHFRMIGLSSFSEVYSKSFSLRTAVCRTARTVVWEDSEWSNHSLPTRLLYTYSKTVT